MLRQSYILLLTYALTVSALPLNINLGAFSPAFVVGDGEISLDGENAGELMETLETGASQTAEEQGVGNVAEVDTAVNAAIAKAQADAAAQEAAQNNNNNPQGGKIDKNPNVKRGKAPRDATSKKNRRNNKRDIAGFRTALNFAKDAQKTQPEVELGTGDEGSGVGIIVNPGLKVPADSAAAGNKKRDVDADAQHEKNDKRGNAGEAQQNQHSRNQQAENAQDPEDDDKLGITVMAIAEI